jgi:hypothetical protein
MGRGDQSYQSGVCISATSGLISMASMWGYCSAACLLFWRNVVNKRQQIGSASTGSGPCARATRRCGDHSRGCRPLNRLRAARIQRDVPLARVGR